MSPSTLAQFIHQVAVFRQQIETVIEQLDRDETVTKAAAANELRLLVLNLDESIKAVEGRA